MSGKGAKTGYKVSKRTQEQTLSRKTGTVTYIVSGEKTSERRFDPGISYNEGN